MRLAVVSPFVDRRHGTERTLTELLERLFRVYGCEIHLYAQQVRDIACIDSRIAKSNPKGGIFWHRVPSVPGPHLVRFLAWIYLNGFLLKRDAKRNGAAYDLIFSPGINSFRSDVVMIHALFHRLQELAAEESRDKVARSGSLRRLHRRIYYWLLTLLERRMYSSRKLVLAAVSQRTANLVNEYFQRSDVRVIPNGVDAAQFSQAKRLERRTASRKQRGFQDEDFVLLLIGNDWRVKGLPTIIEAMAAMTGLSLKLLVVGTDTGNSFHKHVIQLGMQSRVLWEAPRADVLGFYAAADLYVSPSLEDSFGLPVAEAMACGLPVITSSCAGVAECVRDGVDGFVLQEPRDAPALSKLIQKLQADPALRNRIGESAARMIAAWNWDRHAQSVWELLTESATNKNLKAKI